MSEYEARAEAFLERNGLSIKAAFKGDRCPPWEDGKCIHGDRYRVTIRRKAGGSLSFDFWDSIANMQANKRPSTYSILDCISSDAFLPKDPDELIGEIGPMRISQALASVKFTKRLRAFFTERELEGLSEIR